MGVKDVCNLNILSFENYHFCCLYYDSFHEMN